MGFAKCNNKECELHNKCKRFLDEKDIAYINFKNMIVDGVCNYFIEDKVDIILEESKEGIKDNE